MYLLFPISFQSPIAKLMNAGIICIVLQIEYIHCLQICDFFLLDPFIHGFKQL